MLSSGLPKSSDRNLTDPTSLVFMLQKWERSLYRPSSRKLNKPCAKNLKKKKKESGQKCVRRQSRLCDSRVTRLDRVF